MKTKYIRTANDEIIMFPELIQHKEFKHKGPVSAGFVSFSTDENGNPTCACYGRSESLSLESDEENDTELARRQFFSPYM